MTDKIHIENLTKIFGPNIKQAEQLLSKGLPKEEILAETGAVAAVNHVDADIKDGEIFVIMGLSGSGKSTLIRMMNRLIEPTEGRIEIDGQDICRLPVKELRRIRRTKINMVFQNFALFPHRTVLDNTAYGLEIRGVPPEKRRARAGAVLERTGLAAYKDQYPSQLSGGMQQRVGLARALSNDPEILLMDEAFSALDPLIRQDMQDELLELQEQMKKTIVFVTHDLNEALKVGNRIAIMKDGVIVQVGTGEEILTRPADDYIRRFSEGVDRTRILSVEHIMSRPKNVINVERAGLHTALSLMVHQDVPFLILSNSSHALLGYITDKDTALEIQQHGPEASYKSIVRKDIPSVSFDTPIPEVYQYLLSQDMPVVVLDRGSVKGLITRRNIVELLASRVPAGESGAVS